MSRAPLALWFLLGTLGVSLVAAGVANDLDRAESPVESRSAAVESFPTSTVYLFCFEANEAVTVCSLSPTIAAQPASFEEWVPKIEFLKQPQLMKAPAPQPPLAPVPVAKAKPAVEKPAAAKPVAKTPAPAKAPIAKVPAPVKVPVVAKAPVAAAPAKKVAKSVQPVGKIPAKEAPPTSGPQAVSAKKAKVPANVKSAPAAENRQLAAILSQLNLAKPAAPAIVELKPVPRGYVAVGPSRILVKLPTIQPKLELAALNSRIPQFATDGRLTLYQSLGAAPIRSIKASQLPWRAASLWSTERRAVWGRVLKAIGVAAERFAEVASLPKVVAEAAAWGEEKFEGGLYRLTVQVRHNIWLTMVPQVQKLSPIRSAGRPNTGKL